MLIMNTHCPAVTAMMTIALEDLNFMLEYEETIESGVPLLAQIEKILKI